MVKSISRSSISAYLLTYWPILPILLFAIASIIHISISPGWRDIYLYNGDSTTLAAFIKSIQFGQPQQWVFSSQIFFFPEALLYALSYLFTQSVYTSLIFNSILNVIIAHFLFYWIGKQLFDSRLKNQLVSILGIALICTYTLLEYNPEVNRSTFVTLYLFTTYYYGIVLSSLALLALTLFTFKKTSSREKITISYWSMVAITTLTATSNPLLMLQFTLPFILVVSLLFFINKITFKTASILTGTQILGLLLAQILRIPFKKMIGASPNSYINTHNIPQAIHQLGQTISLIVTNKASVIEYSTILIVILAVGAYALWILYHSFRDRAYMKNKNNVLFTALFGAISPGIIVFATLMTGSSYTRYFIPIAFFPTVSLLAVASQLKISILHLKIAVAITCGLFFIYCFWALPKSQPLTHAISSDDIACLEQSVGDKTIYAVGDYWNARPLDLYSNPKKVRVVQVGPALTPLPWLNNKADYELTFDTIIVNKTTSPSAITMQKVESLGKPSQTWNCSNFYIYHYNPNTEGYKLLNKSVHS